MAQRSLSNQRLVKCLAVLACLLLDRHPASVAQDKSLAPSRWEAAIQAFEAADMENPPPADATLFVGASNIRLWKSLPQRMTGRLVLNRGFGGAYLSDVDYFAERIVIRYAPRQVYIQAGGNDLHAGRSPEQVATSFRSLARKLREALPRTQLAFISLPPSAQRWSEVDLVRQANELIASACREDGKIEFIDVFSLLLNEQGVPRPDLYLADRLHFSERGYDVVTSAIRWQSAIRKFDELDRRATLPEQPVLFVGSSSIVRWKSLADDFPNVPVLNRGFGGSEIFDSATFVNRLVLPYHPKMIVMYAGGNDINRGKTPQRVVEDAREFVVRVHAKLPETRIAFISIAGNPARWAQVEQVKEANRLIEEFTKTDPRLTFINVFPHMLGEDGLPKPEIFVRDRLHMNEKGYAIWKEVVGTYLVGGKNSQK